MGWWKKGGAIPLNFILLDSKMPLFMKAWLPLDLYARNSYVFTKYKYFIFVLILILLLIPDLLFARQFNIEPERSNLSFSIYSFALSLQKVFLSPLNLHGGKLERFCEIK